MNRCHGITKCNRRCKKINKLSFCNIHLYQNENCSICLNTIKDKCTLDCNHKFCNDCILEWMCTFNAEIYTNPTCPLCRSEIYDNALLSKSIIYGLKQKIFIYVNEHHYDTSDLSDESFDILESYNIITPMFMNQHEWMHLNNFPDFVDFVSGMQTWTSRALLKIAKPADWDYFNGFNNVYLFD